MIGSILQKKKSYVSVKLREIGFHLEFFAKFVPPGDSGLWSVYEEAKVDNVQVLEVSSMALFSLSLVTAPRGRTSSGGQRITADLDYDVPVPRRHIIKVSH